MSRAQMKMAESIGILVIFFFLLMFGFSFYTKVSQSSFEDKKQEILTKKSVEIAQTAAFLPEVSCSLGSDKELIISDVCLDKYKMEAAKTLMAANKEYYFDIIGYAKIEVREIYPNSWEDGSLPPGTITTWNLYEFIPDDFSRKTIINIPVSIEDPLAQSTAFGYLYMEVYSR